jgi:hypothetical protein
MTSSRMRSIASQGRSEKINRGCLVFGRGGPYAGTAEESSSLRRFEAQPGERQSGYRARQRNRKCSSDPRQPVPSNGHALAGIPAVDQRTNSGVFDELIPVGGGEADFNFANKPFAVANKALHGLENERLGISPPFCRDSGKLTFKLWREM